MAGLEPVPGQFAGLYIEQEDRHDDFMGGTRAESLLKFPEPWEINAITFRLQYFDTTSSAWVNYGTGDDYVTNYNNFVVPSVAGQRMRLLAIGGAADGLVSNEVTLSYANLDTTFTGYSLDESMWLTGVIWPFVGRGLEASFTVKDIDTDTIIEGALTYQWHRVNPYTFAHTPIPGATELTYATTIDDLGYYIAIVATGDGINASGSFEIISDLAPVKLAVKAFATDVSSSSFILRFEYVLPEFSFDYFGIVDTEYAQVVASAVTLGGDGTFATITLLEPTTSSELYVSYEGIYWSIVEHEFGMHQITVTIAE